MNECSRFDGGAKGDTAKRRKNREMKYLILILQMTVFAFLSRPLCAAELVGHSTEIEANASCIPSAASLSSPSRIPKCLSTHGALSHQFPTGAITITYQPGMESVIESILETTRDRSPHVRLLLVSSRDVTTPPSFPSAQEFIRSKQKLGFRNISEISVKADDWETFLRDPFIVSQDPKHQPILFGMPTNRNPGELAKKIADACGLPFKDYRVDTAALPELGEGGNLMILPGGVCVHEGPKHLEKVSGVTPPQMDQLKRNNTSFYRRLHTEARCQRSIETDFSLPVLSHADEVMTSVRIGHGPCDFAILVISPTLGLKTLRDQNGVNVSLRQASTQLQSRIDRNLKLVLRTVSAATNCPDPKVIPLPVLLNDPNSQNLTSFSHPNPINGLVITPPSGASSFLTGRTHVAEFDELIEARLKSAGIDLKLIDIGKGDSATGGIHCATNQIQMCAPN